MELKWVVCGERHEKTDGEELEERITMITEEERVVAERRHGETDAGEIVEVLESWRLEQMNTAEHRGTGELETGTNEHR